MIMKRLSLCLLLLFTNIYKGWSQDEVDLSVLSSYILKNYSLPKTLQLDCDYNYVAVVLESNQKGEITGIRYLNEAHHDLKASLDYVKKFRFDTSMKVKRRPILIIVNIYQQDADRCRIMDPYYITPSKLTQETVKIIKEQIERDPRTILMGVLTFGAGSGSS